MGEHPGQKHSVFLTCLGCGKTATFRSAQSALRAYDTASMVDGWGPAKPCGDYLCGTCWRSVEKAYAAREAKGEIEK